MNTAKAARTRSVGTKLTEAEYAQVETAAARRGRTVGEWSREELLRAAGRPQPAATAAEQKERASPSTTGSETAVGPANRSSVISADCIAVLPFV